jgi:hypothetical protein
LRIGFLDSAEKLIRPIFVLRLIWFSEVFFRCKWLESLKIHQKITFFSVYSSKNTFFSVNALNYQFFLFLTNIQTKKSQLAEYDIVGMLAENLVEVDYVWWVGYVQVDFFDLIFFFSSGTGKTDSLGHFLKKLMFFSKNRKKGHFLMNFQTFKPFAPEEDLRKPYKS